MSDNTYLLINRKTFQVTRNDADTGHVTELGKGKNLEEAVELAHKELQSDWPPEYGVFFTEEEYGSR
jgi:hypothetical protein